MLVTQHHHEVQYQQMKKQMLLHIHLNYVLIQERDAGEYVVTVPYAIEDADDKLTDSSTMTITVYCNQRPVPSPDEATVNEESSVSIPVLNNDNDPENDEISVKEITQPPTKGDASIVDDEIVYTPRTEECVKVAPEPSYQDVLKYNIIDDSTAQLTSVDQQLLLLLLNVTEEQLKQRRLC